MVTDGGGPSTLPDKAGGQVSAGNEAEAWEAST